MKKLYVGNLPYQASESQLETWFVQAGFTPDAVTIIRDRFSGESRGFGFVDIVNDDDANRAIQACNGQDFLGRSLIVNEARPLRERGPAEGRRGGGGGGGDRKRSGGRPRY
jgi:cold-inducible RNA-binding protein